MTYPWFIDDDFNVMLNGEEKIEGLPILDANTNDFRSFIKSCNLAQICLLGGNGKTSDDCIFDRLDGVLMSDEFQSLFAHSVMEHLPRNGSDHAPLKVTCHAEAPKFSRPFKFLNSWPSHDSFKEVVRMN